MLVFIKLSTKKILDVGCGEEVFEEVLINHQNCEVWGNEPNLSSVEIAKKNLFKMIPKSYFDCIIFNDVLEHMLDPWEALKIAKSLLNSSKAVIVASF